MLCEFVHQAKAREQSGELERSGLIAAVGQGAQRIKLLASGMERGSPVGRERVASTGSRVELVGLAAVSEQLCEFVLCGGIARIGGESQRLDSTTVGKDLHQHLPSRRVAGLTQFVDPALQDAEMDKMATNRLVMRVPRVMLL